MPDWKAEIRSRFKGMVDDVVLAELTDHLEDLYDFNRARGMSEVEATEHCLEEAAQIARVSGEIRSAKRRENEMKERVRNFWLPSLAAFASASALLMVFQRAGLEPHVFWRNGVAIAVYAPWLATLPLCGAVGAYLSRRSGGKVAASLSAGLSPAIVMLALFGLILPLSVIAEPLHNPAWKLNVSAVVITVCNWALVPAAALLLGAAPVSWLKRSVIA